MRLINPPKKEKKVVPSKALVASWDGQGCILDYTGTAISHCIEDYSREIGEIGLDDAPDGLSIWDGEMGSVPLGWTPDSSYECDHVVKGAYRDLTPEEWDLLKTQGFIWPAEVQPLDIVSLVANDRVCFHPLHPTGDWNNCIRILYNTEEVFQELKGQCIDAAKVFGLSLTHLTILKTDVYGLADLFFTANEKIN